MKSAYLLALSAGIYVLISREIQHGWDSPVNIQAPLSETESDSSLLDKIAFTHGLTRREKGILGLLIDGKTNKEIGSALFISEPTVKTHISHILQKMQVKDRVQLLSRIFR